MRVYVEGLDLSNAVATVIKATSNKTTNPILEGIKLTADGEYLTLSATDGELAIERKIPADVKFEGAIVVPGKLFAEFVKKLDGEQIELLLDENNKLKLRYTDSEVYIQCQSADEFPRIQEIEHAQFFEVNQRDLKELIEKTKDFNKLYLNIALNYGSYLELTNATKEIANKVVNKQLKIDEISDVTITNHLYTKELPPIDLMIRTGGEKRLSNFMLYQLAYSEIAFIDVLWPDFNKKEFYGVLKDFSSRNRRYGGL